MRMTTPWELLWQCFRMDFAPPSDGAAVVSPCSAGPVQPLVTRLQSYKKKKPKKKRKKIKEKRETFRRSVTMERFISTLSAVPTATRGRASSPQRCLPLAHASVLLSARLRTFGLEK